MRTLTQFLLSSVLLAGCSTAQQDPDIFNLGPDASVEEEALTDVGCMVSISYPAGQDSPESDHLVYDRQGRMVQMRRMYSDGPVSDRKWTWSVDGKTATREWFDGSKVTELDEQGRVAVATTYDADGVATWEEALRYEGGKLMARTVTRLSDDTVWAETIYQYDADKVTRAEFQSMVEPADRSAVRYTYTIQSDGLKMVKGYDTDGDGSVEYKTALLIAPSGLIERGVDESGKLIDYEYEGDLCETVAQAWPVADPFFVDM